MSIDTTIPAADGPEHQKAMARLRLARLDLDGTRLHIAKLAGEIVTAATAIQLTHVTGEGRKAPPSDLIESIAVNAQEIDDVHCDLVQYYDEFAEAFRDAKVSDVADDKLLGSVPAGREVLHVSVSGNTEEPPEAFTAAGLAGTPTSRGRLLNLAGTLNEYLRHGNGDNDEIKAIIHDLPLEWADYLEESKGAEWVPGLDEKGRVR